MKRVLLVLVVALAFPAAASAHATLIKSFPPAQKRIDAAPSTLRLVFDQGVTALPDAIRVYTASGRVVSSEARATKNVVAAPMHAGKTGAYTVRWHVISGDGHVLSGIFTFGVRTAPPTPMEAYGASGPTRSEHVVRWFYFLALALVIGGLGFRLLVVRAPMPPLAERRFYVLTGIGVLATINAGIVAFVLRAEDALQLPFERLLYGDLTPIAKETRFGTAFVAMTLGFALVAALLFLAWLTDRVVFLWPAFVVALAFASGLSLSGHSAADAGSSWKSELADWVHLSAASLWIGGLVQLAVVVVPLAPELRRAALLRFSTFATALIALLLAAGTYLSIVRLPHLHDLWTTGYGHVLIVKLSLVAFALAWGGLHRLLAVPAVAGGNVGVFGRLRHSLLGESFAGMAVLLVAAVLVDSKPPARPAPAGVAVAVADAATAPAGKGVRVHGGHLAVVLPEGAWDGRYVDRPQTQGTPALTFANTALGRWQYVYGQTDPSVRWRTSSVMFTIIDQTAAAASLSPRRIALPLRVRRSDATSFEGIPSNHAFIRRIVRASGRPLEIWIQFGHRQLTAADVNLANRLLRTVKVS